MKIHAYILCYNEEDIISHTLRHYSAFCSRIFLLDNYSTDSSVSIAENFPKVTVLQWWSGGKFDDYKHIKVKQEFYKVYSRSGASMCTEVADWVITCDMDELIYHPELLSVLQEYKVQAVTVANVVGFNMVSAKEFYELYNLIDEVKTGVQAKVFNKPIVFDPVFDMVFSPGCHPSGVRYEQMQKQPLYKKGEVPIALLHYKYIGHRSVLKATQSSLRLSQQNKKNNWGAHYQKTTDELLNKNIMMRKKARQVLDEKGHIIFDASV